MSSDGGIFHLQNAKINFEYGYSEWTLNKKKIEVFI